MCLSGNYLNTTAERQGPGVLLPEYLDISVGTTWESVEGKGRKGKGPCEQ